jgi:imidazolonepropionase-like amidohydrolase
MRSFLTMVYLLLVQITFSQTYAIIADRLIDGMSDQPIANPTIIVHEGKIVGINFKRSIPDSAIVIDLKGHTLLPGLMDVHTHLLADGGDYDKDLYSKSPTFRALRAVKYLRIALNNGITTIRDVCSEGAGFADVDLARAVDSGFIEGPRILPAGKGIAATGQYLPSPSDQNWSIELPYGTQFATGTIECVKAVREQVSRGVSWIKLYADWTTPTFSEEEIRAVVGEAGKDRIDVAAHAYSGLAIRMAIEAGARSIEHGVQFNDSLIQLAIAHGTYWCPTITVFEYFGDRLDSVYKYLNRAAKAKLPIVMGTDIGSFPWDVNETKELEYYVRNAGLTPMDAIKTATVNAAALLRLQHSLGQLREGFKADIIAVRGNPLEDIRLLQHVDFVMKGGRTVKKP